MERKLRKLGTTAQARYARNLLTMALLPVRIVPSGSLAAEHSTTGADEKPCHPASKMAGISTADLKPLAMELELRKVGSASFSGVGIVKTRHCEPRIGPWRFGLQGHFDTVCHSRYSEGACGFGPDAMGWERRKFMSIGGRSA